MAAEGKEAYAVFDSSDGSLTFFVDDEEKYTNGEVIGTKTYWTGIEEDTYGVPNRVPWHNYLSSILSVSFNNEISPVSLLYWFSYCENLVEITNISNLNTSNVTLMMHMFQQCKALTSLDLSNFNTSKVTTMYGMFEGCETLTSLDLSNFDTSKVKNMGYMFDSCKKLKSINLYSFNTSNVTNMRNMFSNCTKLASLYISTFDTSHVTNMSWMFGNSISLMQIFVGKQWDISKVSDSFRMFFSCVNLPNFDSNYIDKTRAYYGEKDGVEGYLTWDREAYAKLEVDGFEGTLTFFTDYSGKYTNEEVIDGIRYFTGVENTGTTTASIPWYEYRIQITKVVAIDKIIPKSLCYWFYNSGRTTSIDLSNFDTSNVVDMSYMFYTCFYLTSLDLSGLNTSNVTNMSHIFQGCKNLTSLDLSNFNTSNVRDMSWMFADCKNLTSLNLSNFDTSKVIDMRGMFSNIGGFNLDISNFNFSTFYNTNTRGAASIFANSTFTSIKFPTTNCFKGNWNTAFQGAYLKQNILVDTTPSSYTDMFTDLSSDSEVYIIWNGDSSTANNWSTICSNYSNAHYELDDATFSPDLTKSARGIYDSTNDEWATDDGGDYIRFILNYGIPTTNIPFGFSNTGNTIKFYRRDGSVSTYLDPEQGEIITDLDNSNTYYHEIDSTKLKDNYNYYGVATIQFTDGTLTLSKSATTPDVTILGQFAIIDVLPKGHTIALGRVAEKIYETISSPTGSPKDQGWYELVSGEYVLSTDDTVSTGKTYYKEAPSLQIGLPMYLPAKGRLYGVKTESGNEINQTIIGINGSNLLHIGASQNTIPVGIYGSNFTLSSAGNLFLNNDRYIYGKETGGTNRLLIGMYSNNNILVGDYKDSQYHNNIIIRGINFRVTSSGEVTLGGHASSIGSSAAAFSKSGYTQRTTSGTNTLGKIELTPGDWILKGWIQFPANSTGGRRKVWVTSSPTMTADGNGYINQSYAAAGTTCTVQAVIFAHLDETTPYYLRGESNVDIDINYCGISGIRIS